MENQCPNGYHYHQLCNSCKVNGKDSVELLQFVKGLEIWLLFPIIEYTVKVNHTIYIASFIRTISGILVFTPLLPLALFLNILAGIIMNFFPIDYYSNVEAICEQQRHHRGYAFLGFLTFPVFIGIIWLFVFIICQIFCIDCCFCDCYANNCECGCYTFAEVKRRKEKRRNAKRLNKVTKLSSSN